MAPTIPAETADRRSPGDDLARRDRARSIRARLDQPAEVVRMVAAFVAVLIASGSALAQPGGDLKPVEDPPPAAPPYADPNPPPMPPASPPVVGPPTGGVTPVVFSDEPLVLSELALKFLVPQGWGVERVTRQAAPARLIDQELSRRDRLALTWTTLAVEDQTVVEMGPPDGTLLVRIQTPRVEDETLPLDVLAQSLAQRIVNDAAANSGASHDAYAIFEKTPDLQVAGHAAYRFYMRVPRRSQETGLVLGYTLIDLPGPRFLVLEFVTPEEHYVSDATRSIYETVVAAMTFIDPGSIDDRRRQLILAGSKFISQQTESNYVSAMARLDGRLERLYTPGGTGADSDDQERGVRRYHAWAGLRGQIDPSKPKDRYDEVEREEGYLVSISGRYLDTAEDPATGQRGLIVADLVTTYWMSRDRQREAWLYRMQVRTQFGNRPDVYTEIGARDGDSLTVMLGSLGRPARTIRPVIESSAYISQVEFYLFPELLAQAGIPTEFGAYAWQSTAETCRFVSDEAIPEGDGLGWTIRRSFGDTDEVNSYSYDGELRWTGTLRELGPARIRCQPTTGDRITRLWTSKGLPLANATPPRRGSGAAGR